ncbi:MAG: hypothetical protein KY428_06445 [Bacteroidetes bacterium]|nr:hypothetical protein [Bacteroidota bacterium]
MQPKATFYSRIKTDEHKLFLAASKRKRHHEATFIHMIIDKKKERTRAGDPYDVG